MICSGGFMKLLTYRELGESLSLSVRYLQKCAKKGSLPYIRFGRAVRFDPNTISIWIKQHNSTYKSHLSTENHS